jgi:cytochrome c oxidase cbb3-type subunit 2
MSFGVGKYEMDEIRLISLGPCSSCHGLAGYALYAVERHLTAAETQTLQRPAADQAVKVTLPMAAFYCHSQQPRDIAQAPDSLRGWDPGVCSDRLRRE